MKTVDQNQQELQRKAATLIEALPYMRKYAGETFVIKYGGNAMVDSDLSRQFAEDVVLMKQVGINPVVIHGGGPQIGKMLDRLNLTSEFKNGLRVTDANTMEVAEMVLSGTINKGIVADINAVGGNAVGLSGKDGSLITAKKYKPVIDGKAIDLGFVGEPAHINPDIVEQCIHSNMIPVIAPIAVDADGQTYNINADTMAGAIAGALKARRLYLLTDVPGVLSKDKELLSELSENDVDELIKNGTIYGGMMPKVGTCLNALRQGARAASILDGRVMHAILLEIFTERGIGTIIRQDDQSV